MAFTVSQACSAAEINAETVNQLINKYLSTHDVINEKARVTYKSGDFNGDAKEDIAVIFQPTSKPVKTAQLTVNTLWSAQEAAAAKKYYKSLAIFNGNNDKWESGKIRVFVMLDTLGVLETPSFELLVSKKSDKDYIYHSEMLPVKTNSDLLVLPTEAGIDTYIYWDNHTYKLFEPEEMP